MYRIATRWFFIIFFLLLAHLSSDIAIAQQKAVGPVLKITPDPILFDSVQCRLRKCVTLTFKNVGDTLLVVHNIDKIARPFYARIDTPFTLQPGEAKSFEYCYTPLNWTRDSQAVNLRADTRVPISIGMLFDVSFSMITMMPDGKRRIDGTNVAGREFVGYLLDTLGIEDEAAVYTFDIDEHFKKVQSFTKDTALLRAAVPAVVTGTATCTYDALSRVIDSLRYRSKARFIVVLTDGDDSGKPTCGPDGVDSVLRKAAETDTRIYTITIGNVDQSDLSLIATATGGKYFNATNSLDLLAVYRQIATELSKNNTVGFGTKGTGIGPRIEIEPKDLQFDSVQVGQTKCLAVSIRNGGNAPLPADSVRKLFRPPYALHNLIPDIILPFQTVPATVCFSPTLPRDFTAVIPFLASPCEIFNDTIRAGAKSYLVPRIIPPRAKLDYNAPLFDTTMCGTTECLEVVFGNSGDTVLTIHSVDPIAPPFSGSIPAPFTIAPDDEQRFTVCYRPLEAPRDDTLRLGFEADLRPTQTIGLLFDEGASMAAEFLPGVSRLTSAVAGASDFIDGLPSPGSEPDRAAVLRFTEAGKFTDTPLLSDPAMLQAALSDTVRTQASCVYAAVEHAVDALAGDNGARKLILFSAGEDAGAVCGTADAQSAGLRAAQKGVRVFAVQIGDGDSTGLAALAAVSGGEYHHPSDLFELILTLRDIDARMVERLRGERLLIGHAVTPIVALREESVDFGTSDTGIVRTKEIVIYNTGTAALRIPTASLVTPPFYFDCSTVPAGGPPPPFVPMALPDTLIIMPGDSAVLCVAFKPIWHGEASDTLHLVHNGCMQPEMSIILQGVGISRPDIPWEYPVALQSPGDVEFGEVPCNSKKCTPLSFTNPGNTDAVLRFIHSPAPPYSLTPDDTLRIPAGGQAEAQLCFEPRGRESVDDLLVVESFVRPRYGIVALLARDSWMDLGIGGLTADDAAQAAVRMLTENITADPSDGDMLKVYGMQDASLEPLIEAASTVSYVGVWPPVPPSGAAANLTTALERAIDSASTLEGSRHVIVLASRINVGSSFQSATIAARAAAKGVHLHFQLFRPSSADSLKVHGGTLWSYAEYSDMAPMSTFLHNATLQGLDIRRDTINATGRGVAPKLDVEPTALSYGTVTVGGDRCLPVTLRNSGTAPLRIAAIINPADPLPVEVPGEIAPGLQARIDLCFKSRTLGMDSATIRIIYESCPLDTILLTAFAFGMDSINVGISGLWVGKPGSVTVLPVKLFGLVPADYDVRQIELEVQFNKTMLYPLDPSQSQESSLVGNMQSDGILMSRFYEGEHARVNYRINGRQPLAGTQTGETLLRLPFLVLLGNSLSTPVTITQVLLNGGLPRAGVAVNGEFRVDSLCFMEQRLLDSGNRIPAKITGVTPNPFNETTTITFELNTTGQVRMSIHDIMGRVVMEALNGPLAVGNHTVVLDANGWPTGTYLCRLEVDGITVFARLIVSR